MAQYQAVPSEGKMKRAVGKKLGDYSEEGMLEFEEVDIPEVTGDLVLIQVKAAALNLIDCKRAKGSSCQFPPIHPLSDVSGIVIAKGPDCKGDLKVGDQVVCCKYPPPSAGLAEYFVAPENTVGPKPGGWSFVQGAALPMGILTADKVIEKANLTSESTAVLVGASGFVGSMILVLNRAIGAPILAVASGAKANYVKQVGGPTVTTCDYKTEDWSQRFTKDNPPEVVMDVSAVSPLDSYYKACALGSKTFVTTNPTDPSFNFSCCCCCGECCFQCKANCCFLLGCRPAYSLALFETKDAANTFQTCSELAAKGQLQPVPLDTFPPKQVHMAYGVMQNTGKKTVVDLSSGI